MTSQLPAPTVLEESVYRVKEHIYENKLLTFAEIKKIFENVSSATIAATSLAEEGADYKHTPRKIGYLEEAECYTRLQELAEKKLLTGAMSRLDELMKKAGVKDENTILEYMISRLGKEMQGEVPDFAKRAVIKKILGVRGISTLDILRKIDGPERKNFKHYLSKPGQIELLNKSVSPLESNMVMFVFESLRAMRSALMMEGSQEAKKLSKNIENVIKEAHNASMTESIRSLKRGLSELAVVERYFKKNIDFAYNESKYSVKMCETPIREMLKLFKGNSKQHSQPKKEEEPIKEEKEIASLDESRIVKRGNLYCVLDSGGNNKGCYHSVYGALKRKQNFRKRMHAEEQELEETAAVGSGAVAGSLGAPIVGVKINRKKKSGDK